jgi:hypothetical protein
MKQWMIRKHSVIVTALCLCLITGLALAQRPGGGGRRKPRYEGPAVYENNIPKPDRDLSGKVTFARIRFDMGIYSGYGFGPLGDGGPPWSHDYPIAGRHLMKIMAEVSKVDATLDVNEPIFRFGDPELFKFPFVYLAEVGFMDLSEQEIAGMREYLLRGGFVCVDDFRDEVSDNSQFGRLAYHVKRAFPEQQYQLRKLDISHPIFNCFFSIKTLDLPPIYGGRYVTNTTPNPEFWGLEDETGRLMMIINYNYDVSDYWQWSDNPFRPIEETNEAYKFGVNYIIYALTH